MSDKKAEAPGTKPSDSDARITSRWHLMRNEICWIDYYIATVASAFNRELKEFDAVVARWAAKVPEDLKGAFYEHASGSEPARNLTQRFPEFAWQTTFVAIYSFLEDEMLGICRVVGERLGIKLDPNDLRDEGIRAAKKYLEDRCGIPFPGESHPWQEALHYNRLRNAIVHVRGYVNRSKKAETIRRYVQGNESVAIDNFDRLQLSQEFCLEVLENVKLLLDDLFQLARKRLS
jgi:hypothetical protein